MKNFTKFKNDAKFILLFGMVLFLSTTIFSQESSGPQTSDNGLFTLTKESDVSMVPSGGGTVVYTYSITNTISIVFITLVVMMINVLL